MTGWRYLIKLTQWNTYKRPQCVLYRVKDALEILIFSLPEWTRNILGIKFLNDETNRLQVGINGTGGGGRSVLFGLTGPRVEKLYKFNTIFARRRRFMSPENVVSAGREPTSFSERCRQLLAGSRRAVRVSVGERRQIRFHSELLVALLKLHCVMV